MINAFYDRVERDELLSAFSLAVCTRIIDGMSRVGGVRVFGGPALYTEQLGGYERMLHKHLKLGITGAQRFRFASLMSLAADDAGMPKDPEFRSAWSRTPSGERGLHWGTPNPAPRSSRTLRCRVGVGVKPRRIAPRNHARAFFAALCRAVLAYAVSDNAASDDWKKAARTPLS
jgi:truncated hemoglobin YjbI